MSAVSPRALPDSVDSPAIRHAGRELLSLALMDARNHTLHLLSHYEQALAEAQLRVPQFDDLELPLWLAGHVGWFAEAWICRNTQRSLGEACPAEPTRTGSIEPHADRWWNPALAPHAQRWQLDLPDAAAVRAYLLQTLETTLELLEKAPEDDAGLYFFRLALLHEDLVGEQWLRMAQVLGLPLRLDMPAPQQQRDALLLPATRWQLGMEEGGFAFDIERPAHEVAVPEFEIDAQPVTWAQYVEFVDDGGYDRQELWHEEGWRWLERKAAFEGRRGPRYVEQIGVASGAVLQTRFGKATRMAGSQCAMHVSWWEADAWARWAGRRLPTEVEWEIAAGTASRRGFRWGEAHEWTAGRLRPWPGFRAGPWLGYAQPWFEQARVVRGASFATRARLKHPKFRGFAMPERDDGFIGFRSCAP